MLIALIVTMMAAVLPVINASAAPLNDDPPPAYGKNAAPRLERAYQRLQTWYKKQGEFISKSGDFIAKAEVKPAKNELPMPI